MIDQVIVARGIIYIACVPDASHVPKHAYERTRTKRIHAIRACHSLHLLWRACETNKARMKL
jgi:hypothetical protein